MAKATEKIVAIIQARLGSSRLPLKSLLTLKGLPVIDWVTRRVAKSRYIDQFIVAVPDTPLDQVLLEHLQRQGINCIAGPEDDVLRRYVLAADSTGADTVVRVCADNPLVSGEAIDALVQFYAENQCDYAWNHIPRNNLWPDGLGAEIIPAALLREMDIKAALPAQREHCLNYIWDNADKYRLATFDPALPALRRPDIRLDLDKPADFQRLALLDIDPEMRAMDIINAWDRQA